MCPIPLEINHRLHGRYNISHPVASQYRADCLMVDDYFRDMILCTISYANKMATGPGQNSQYCMMLLHTIKISTRKTIL